jgi:hypothetical protein
MKSNLRGSQELLQSVLETLDQGEALLAQLSDEDYTRRVPVAFNASIGGHYRHCLDHFRCLLDAAAQADLNYDHRERGTLVERDRFAALLNVTCKTSYATIGSQASPSTVGREIMYSVAHAVHHYALIGVMCGVIGLEMPTGFGVAPSTLKQMAELAKVTG